MSRDEPALPLDPAIPTSLASPDAYPHDPSAAAGVQEIQTHLSHVFLTTELVYKLKKSVDVGFVSFLSQAARNRDCVREVELNRRLAPDVYLGVAPIVPDGRSFAVGAVDSRPGPLGAGEHCVVMRRLAPGRDASTLLDAGALPAEWLGAAAERLAAFHAEHGLGRPAPFSPEAWLARVWAPVQANFDTLHAKRSETLLEREVDALRDATTKAFEALKPHLEARRLAGRAVDGHGDLHLQHFWFEKDDGVPLVIDCLEFSDELRQVDAASEVAFLAMDLAYRGHDELAEYWLARYASAADDYDLYRVVDFFIAYRAAVRGKVEAIEAGDALIPEAQRKACAQEARRRVAFATRALASRAPGELILVGGLIGSGKSSVARELSLLRGAVVLSSDLVRRQDPVARSQEGVSGGWQQGRYTPAARERIYEEMLERAEAAVAAGRPVILDASWSSAKRRAQVRDWARARGSRSRFVEVRCGREETLARLAERRQQGRDASEAGPEIYDAFARDFEPVSESEWPLGARHTLHTDRTAWRDELQALLSNGGP